MSEPQYRCGVCGRTWDFPTPASRCPYEYDHEDEVYGPDGPLPHGRCDECGQPDPCPAHTHSASIGTHFSAKREADFDVVQGKIVRYDPIYVDVVEPPTCGFWLVSWQAEHPERGMETGTWLVSKTRSYDGGYADEQYARGVVAEILWSRNYIGQFNTHAKEPW